MAEFRIDQATPGTGNPGEARHDLVSGEIITLVATDPVGAGVSYTWEIVDKVGSTAVLSATTGSSVTIGAAGLINQPCTFEIQLTANDNGNITTVRRIASVRTANAGLRIPTFAETAPLSATLDANDPDDSTDNAQYTNLSGLGASGQNWRSWAEWAYEATVAIDTATGSGGPPSGAAGGDLAGTYPNPTVDGLQGVSISASSPALNDVLTYNGVSWEPLPGSATSALQDAYDGGNDITIAAATSVVVNSGSETVDLLVLNRTNSGAGDGVRVAMGGTTTGNGITVVSALGATGPSMQAEIRTGGGLLVDAQHVGSAAFGVSIQDSASDDNVDLTTAGLEGYGTNLNFIISTRNQSVSLADARDIVIRGGVGGDGSAGSPAGAGASISITAGAAGVDNGGGGNDGGDVILTPGAATGAGTVGQVLLGIDGIATQPVLAFASAPGTGMRLNGSDISFVRSGEKMKITADRVQLRTGVGLEMVDNNNTLIIETKGGLTNTIALDVQCTDDFDATTAIRQTFASFTGTVNQSASALGYTGVLVDITETAAIGTDDRLLDLQVGSVTQAYVTNAGKVLAGQPGSLNPGLSFVGATDMGVEHVSGTTMGFVVGGTRELTLSNQSLAPQSDGGLQMGGTTIGFSRYFAQQSGGSAALPSFTWAGASNTSGFFLVAEDVIGITNNGVQSAAINGQLVTATGDEVAFDLAVTVNKATSGNYTGIKLDVTETAAPGTDDRLLDLQVGAVSQMYVTNGGRVRSGDGTAPLPAYSFVSAPAAGMSFTGSALSFSNSGGSERFRIATNQVALVVGGSATTPGLDMGIGAATGIYEDPGFLGFTVEGVSAARIRSQLDLATGDEVAFALTATVNKATSGNYTGIQLDVTETAAPGADDRLLDLKVGGVSQMYVTERGHVRAGDTAGSGANPQIGFGNAAGMGFTAITSAQMAWSVSGVNRLSFSGALFTPLVDNNMALGSAGARWVDFHIMGQHINTVSAATGDEELFDFAGTVNKATSGNYTGIKLNVIETAAPGTDDRLLDLQVGGVSQMYVRNDGDLVVEGSIEQMGSDSSQLIFGNVGASGFAGISLRNLNDFSGSAGFASGVDIRSTINQSGTAAFTSLTMVRTETALGSGNQYFMECIAGSTQLFIRNDGTIAVAGSGSASLPAVAVGGTGQGIYRPAASQLGLVANSEAVIVDNDSTTPSLRPDVDNTWTLGESGLRWADLFATTTTVGDVNLFSLHDKSRWTINEDARGLWLHNRNTGKVYRFLVEEVDPMLAPKPVPLREAA